MLFDKGKLGYISIALYCSFSGAIAFAAYEETNSKNGWAEFDAQMLEDYHRKANNRVRPAYKPQALASNEQMKKNVNRPVSRPQEKSINNLVNSKIDKTHPDNKVVPGQVQASKQEAKKHVRRPVFRRLGTLPNQPVDSKMGAIHPVYSGFFSSPVVTLSVGPVWESAGQTQTLTLTPFIKKTYNADNDANVLVDGELFVGVEHALNPMFQGQLGLALAATSNGGLSGTIWDDADPEFNNYTYSYHVQHVHVALKGKLLTNRSIYAIKPYISASLGVGFNTAQNFSNVPLIFEAVETPNFSSKTTTTFTYTLGIGIQRAINNHWQVGIGYEFADWGKSQLGAAPGQTQGEGPSLNQLHTNGMLFNLTYLG